MAIFILIVVLVCLIGLIIDTGRQLYLWTKLIFAINPIVFSVIFAGFIIFTLTFYILSRIPNSQIPRVLLVSSHYLLGVITYLVVIVSVVRIFLVLCKLSGIFETLHTSKVQLLIGALTLVFVLFLNIYGSFHATNIQTKEYEINLSNETGTNTLKIALISDIHLGYIIDANRVEQFVEIINESDVDIVLIAGDFFDGDTTAIEEPKRVQELFQSIETKYGVYACLGNHDAGSTYNEMVQFITDSGVTLLMDESITIDEEFILVGRRDLTPIGEHGVERISDFKIENPNDLPVIVMDHQPSAINEYNDEVDLIVAGHTHQGQFFPFSIVTNAIFDVDYGYYQAASDKPHVVVTSGVGTWGPPIRVLTQSEVVLIEFGY